MSEENVLCDLADDVETFKASKAQLESVVKSYSDGGLTPYGEGLLQGQIQTYQRIITKLEQYL